MLLGLNRVLYHDFLPPWGVEFLVRVNAQAWWYYAQYEFGSRHEMPRQNSQERSSRTEDEGSLGDDASVGDRPEGDDLSNCLDQTQSATSPASTVGGNYLVTFNSSEASGQNGTGCDSKPASPERSWSFSSGKRVHCSLSCTGGCGDADRCYLQCSCRKEEIKAEDLLPRFDWEEDDGGQGFVDLL